MQFSLIFASVCCKVCQWVGQPGSCLPDVLSFCQLRQKAVVSVLQGLFEWGLRDAPGCGTTSGPHVLWLLEPRKPLRLPACGQGEVWCKCLGCHPHDGEAGVLSPHSLCGTQQG